MIRVRFSFVIAAFLVTIVKTEETWTPSPYCPYPSEVLTRFPYEGDCSKFWECFEGARYPMDCPAGLEFNYEGQQCDTPSLANCDADATIIYPTFPHTQDPSAPTEESTVTTETSEPWTPDSLCPYPSHEIVFFIYPGNCSKYYECYEGIKFVQVCPDNLYWNQILQACDYPEDVDCNDGTRPTEEPTSTADPADNTSTTTTPSSGSTSTPSAVSCVGFTDGSLIANPDNCHKFYECVGEIAIEQECPGSLLFNEALQICDYSTDVSNCKLP